MKLTDVVVTEFGLRSHMWLIVLSFSPAQGKELGPTNKTPPTLVTSDGSIGFLMSSLSLNRDLNLFVRFSSSMARTGITSVGGDSGFKTPDLANKRHRADNFFAKITESFKTEGTPFYLRTAGSKTKSVFCSDDDLIQVAEIAEAKQRSKNPKSPIVERIGKMPSGLTKKQCLHDLNLGSSSNTSDKVTQLVWVTRTHLKCYLTMKNS